MAINEDNSMVLLEDIFRFRDEKELSDMNLMDVILEYARAKNIDEKEIGDELAENQMFVSMFRRECEKLNYFKKNQGDADLLDDWE